MSYKQELVKKRCNRKIHAQRFIRKGQRPHKLSQADFEIKMRVWVEEQFYLSLKKFKFKTWLEKLKVAAGAFEHKQVTEGCSWGLPA